MPNTRFFVDENGRIIGGFGDGAEPPAGAIGVPEPPPSDHAVWQDGAWHVPATVPASVSRFQAKAALAMAGLLDQANAAVAESGNIVLQLAWAEATEFKRNSPGISALAPALGLDDAALDQLFIAAAEIVA